MNDPSATHSTHPTSWEMLAVRDELNALRGFKEGVEAMAPRLHREIEYQKQDAERYALRCEGYEEILRYVKLKLSESSALLNEIDAALEKPWS